MLKRPGVRKVMKIVRKPTTKSTALPPTEKAGSSSLKRKRIYKFTRPNV
jgi:hypothetical protein